MTVTAVVQARMGSTRLPGKVLAEVGGMPLLQFMLQRVRDLPLAHLVVATSDAAGDDPVAEVAQRAGAAVVRGPEQDVLERFRLSVASYPGDTVIRLTADCPLVDPEVIAAVVGLHLAEGADYTSNTLIRTYPDGLDVEAMSAAALMTAADEARDPVEREHVTPFIYRRPERFLLRAQRSPLSLGDERWTVDTAEDLAFIRDVVEQVPPGAGWRAIVDRIGLRARTAERPLSVRVAGVADLERTGPWAVPHLHDPTVRTWIAEMEAVPVGWLRMEVTGGVGTLHTDVAPDLLPAVLPALTQSLRGDHQVFELRVPGLWTLDEQAMAAAGFSPRPDGFAWLR